MERLEEYLYKLGELKKVKTSPDFCQKTIDLIKKKRKEFFAHSALIFAVFILIMYISGITLVSINNSLSNLKIYIFSSISFFIISFTLFWVISNERFIIKFLNKIFGENFVEKHINIKNCYFTRNRE